MMQTPPLRIVIVDDELERSTGWARGIEALLGTERLTVQALAAEPARKLLETAAARRREAREYKQDPFGGHTPSPLDDVDILIVDYDLQELLAEGQWSTGSQVATLARAFTNVKLVVLVNQFGTNTFDLTMIKSKDSPSDQDVGSDQLLNPALWDRSRVDGYAPWSWNDGLLCASQRMQALVDWISGRLDEPVLQALGFASEPRSGESDTSLASDLWQQCLQDPRHSFRDMVLSSSFLTPKERDEGIGHFDALCARTAASLVSHWLDRWVIPSNEVLVDLPHVAAVYPWLLAKKEDINCWQAACSLLSPFDAFLPALRKHEFTPGFPLARPVVWRTRLLEDAELAEPTGFTYDGFPDVVFCEDTSRFHEYSDARPFSCRLPGTDTQRFTAKPDRVKPIAGGHPLTDIVYEPSVLFAL